jgi:cell division protein ZapA
MDRKYCCRIKDEVTNAESDKNDKNNEIFELKHEILDLKDQLATAKKEISDLKKENFDAQKDIVRLETELEERAKRNIRTNIK